MAGIIVMSNYREMYENKASVEQLLSHNINPTTFDNWEDAYWFAMCLVAQNDYSYDRKVLDAFDIAFYKGLNVETDRDKYLEALQITAKLHYAYSDYVQTSNKLLVLLNTLDYVPVWVNLYFAISQIYTNLLLVSEDPDFFLFEYLDTAVTKEEKAQRNSIFLDFLNVLLEKRESDEIGKVEAEIIFDKACEYGLNTEKTLLYFKNGFGIDKPIPVIEMSVHDDINENIVDAQAQKELIAANARIVELQSQIEKLQAIIDEQESRLSKLSIEEQPSIRDGIDEIEKESSFIEQEIDKIQGNQKYNHKKIQSLFRPRQQILVIGSQQNNPEKLIQHASKKYGLDRNYFEFVLDYDKIKNFAQRITPYSDKYAGIIIGESPHKAAGIDDYSSFISMLEQEHGYPYTIRAIDSSGRLKLSKSSFDNALSRLVEHGMACGGFSCINLA